MILRELESYFLDLFCSRFCFFLWKPNVLIYIFEVMIPRFSVKVLQFTPTFGFWFSFCVNSHRCYASFPFFVNVFPATNSGSSYMLVHHQPPVVVACLSNCAVSTLKIFSDIENLLVPVNLFMLIRAKKAAYYEIINYIYGLSEIWSNRLYITIEILPYNGNWSRISISSQSLSFQSRQLILA